MQDYEKVRLAVVNLLYGSVGVLLTLALGAFFVVTYVMRTPANDGFMFSPRFKASLILLAITVTTPALLSGYGLLKQKAWAKRVGLIASLAAMINFPFGTGVGLYSLWLLRQEERENVFLKLSASNSRKYNERNYDLRCLA